MYIYTESDDTGDAVILVRDALGDLCWLLNLPPWALSRLRMDA